MAALLNEENYEEISAKKSEDEFLQIIIKLEKLLLYDGEIAKRIKAGRQKKPLRIVYPLLYVRYLLILRKLNQFAYKLFTVDGRFHLIRSLFQSLLGRILEIRMKIIPLSACPLPSFAEVISPEKEKAESIRAVVPILFKEQVLKNRRKVQDLLDLIYDWEPYPKAKAIDMVNEMPDIQIIKTIQFLDYNRQDRERAFATLNMMKPLSKKNVSAVQELMARIMVRYRTLTGDTQLRNIERIIYPDDRALTAITTPFVKNKDEKEKKKTATQTRPLIVWNQENLRLVKSLRDVVVQWMIEWRSMKGKFPKVNSAKLKTILAPVSDVSMLGDGDGRKKVKGDQLLMKKKKKKKKKKKNKKKNIRAITNPKSGRENNANRKVINFTPKRLDSIEIRSWMIDKDEDELHYSNFSRYQLLHEIMSSDDSNSSDEMESCDDLKTFIAENNSEREKIQKSNKHTKLKLAKIPLDHSHFLKKMREVLKDCRNNCERKIILLRIRPKTLKYPDKGQTLEDDANLMKSVFRRIANDVSILEEKYGKSYRKEEIRELAKERALSTQRRFKRSIAGALKELFEYSIVKFPITTEMHNFMGCKQTTEIQRMLEGLEARPDLGDVRDFMSILGVYPFFCGLEMKSPRTFLLAGPPKSGKRTLVECVCGSLGAVLINLSPAILDARYSRYSAGKKLAKLIEQIVDAVHPVVILITECDKFFPLKRKKNDYGSYYRPLIRFLRKLVVKGERRALLFGTMRKPHNISVRRLEMYFEQIILLPRPTFESRCQLWQHLLKKYELYHFSTQDIVSLSQVTEGYCGGHIDNLLKRLVTPFLQNYLNVIPIKLEEIIQAMRIKDFVFEADENAYKLFYRHTKHGQKNTRKDALKEKLITRIR